MWSMQGLEATAASVASSEMAAALADLRRIIGDFDRSHIAAGGSIVANALADIHDRIITALTNDVAKPVLANELRQLDTNLQNVIERSEGGG